MPTMGLLNGYVVINGSNNVFTGCSAERYTDPNPPFQGVWPSHGGHGFTVQAYTNDSHESKDNKFFDCSAKHIDATLEFRGRGTSQNLVERYVSDLDGADGHGGNPGRNVIISSFGTFGNVFRQVRLIETDDAICFHGNEPWINQPEDRRKDVEASIAGVATNNNLFENCIFEKCTKAFQFSYYQLYEYEANGQTFTYSSFHEKVFDNTFKNCSFIANPNVNTTFAITNREGSNNVLKNCIISGFDTYEGVNAFLSFPTGITFDHCCLNNDASAGFPTGQNLPASNIEADPVFIGNDFDLGNGSPCIEAGTALSVPNLDIDYDGDARGGLRFDIGAQEWVSSGSGS